MMRKIYRNYKSVLLIIFICFLSDTVKAGCKSYIPSDTPNERFDINDDGLTVRDIETGLTWSRCSLGQTGNECATFASLFDFSGALSAAEASTIGGFSDWRLPNIKELMSIVAVNCSSPSINLEVFPNTPSGITSSGVAWSSTPGRSISETWSIRFGLGGETTQYSFRFRAAVRLVRDTTLEP
ncbi:MAG: hypothetical protein ACI9SP_004640 [Arenicella sp.]|jgi:hypothetical protein